MRQMLPVRFLFYTTFRYTLALSDLIVPVQLKEYTFFTSVLQRLPTEVDDVITACVATATSIISVCAPQ